MPADLHEPTPEPGAEPRRGVHVRRCGGGRDGARDGACGVTNDGTCAVTNDGTHGVTNDGTCAVTNDGTCDDPRDDPSSGARGVPGPGEGAAAAAVVVAEYLDPGLPPHEQLQEALDRTPTGVPLVRLLEALDPRSLDDYDLAELAAGFARMAGWVHANLAAVAVELARRPGMAPRPDPRSGRGTGLTSERIAATALSARLHRSPQDVAALVREGSEFSGALAATGEALRAGRISVPAARAIAARLADQVTWVSQPVQDYVLPRAEHSTVSQVRADLERALLLVDPEHAQDRRDTARTQRRVTHPRALPDQMAEMHVVLPAEHAVGIDTALERAARSARAGGDPRTLDQLRADGLVDSILTGTPLAGRDAERTSPAATPGYLPEPRDGAGIQSGVTTAGGACAGAEAGAGAGADVDVEAGSDSGTAVGSGAGAGVSTAADAGACVSAAAGASAAASGEADAGAEAGAGAEADLGAEPGAGAAAGPPPHTAAADRAGPRDPRTHVLVTVPLSSLIGEDDAPAELAGFGPIDATTARALAQGGVWRRLVTDDLSGSVLDVGRTTYRPPAALADHVRFRDRTCTYPGCRVPAHRCDLDHCDDWSPAPDDPRPPGTTSHTNLGPTCPRHHRAKHQARFDVRQRAPGEHEWTDPTGHRYRTRPGADVPPQHLTGPRRLRDSSRAVQDSSVPTVGEDEPTSRARPEGPGPGAPDDAPPF